MWERPSVLGPECPGPQATCMLSVLASWHGDRRKGHIFARHTWRIWVRGQFPECCPAKYQMHNSCAHITWDPRGGTSHSLKGSRPEGHNTGTRPCHFASSGTQMGRAGGPRAPGAGALSSWEAFEKDLRIHGASQEAT